MENLSIITEVGCFGDLDIEDPSETEVKKKKKQGNVDELIEQAIRENATINIE